MKRSAREVSMNPAQQANYKEKATAGKYRRLYERLNSLQSSEWKTCFSEIESVLGFNLPASTRRYTAWWANEKGDSPQSQSIAWTAAGWETTDVNIDAETLSFRRRIRFKTDLLDEIWPARSAGGWPKRLSLRREDLYEDRV